MSDTPIVYADVLDAEPAPRELTAVARRYLRAQASWLWLGLAIFFLVVPGVIAVAAIPMTETIVALAVDIGIAIAVGWWTGTKRARLRKVLIDGTQTPAQILSVATLQVRRGLVSGQRVTIDLAVNGRRTRCASWAGDLDDAERGAWIRVLVHADVPDLVVPVVSVT
jgi:hypothetical protein